MAAMQTQQGYVLDNGAGSALWAMGERLVLKATSAQTGGAFTLFEDLVAAGGEPPPHFHEHEDEAYYLLEGSMEVMIGEQVYQAGPGSFVFLPRMVPHHWRVTSSEPLRMLVFFTPAGVEGFFQALSRPAEAATPPPPSPPDLPMVIQTAGVYGIRLAGPPPMAASATAE
jgi:quercetin dioxygenase-like cupin family protein